ncbi:hypothetical protein ALT1644_630005 [Alteromonas macleodii]
MKSDVGSNPPGVRIPHSPPYYESPHIVAGFFMPVYYARLSYKTTVALLHFVHMFRLALFFAQSKGVMCHKKVLLIKIFTSRAVVLNQETII